MLKIKLYYEYAYTKQQHKTIFQFIAHNQRVRPQIKSMEGLI